MSVSSKTDFEHIAYSKYSGQQSKILVIFTEHKHPEMKNGKRFSTGNHPVEALLPMLHLNNARFDFETVTATGKPVVFETWAFPSDDEAVNNIYDKYQSSFKNPVKLSDFIDTDCSE